MSPSNSYDGFLEALRPGLTAYVPAASGELAGLRDALAAAPERLAGVTLVSAFIPGMNAFDYAALNHQCRVVTFLLPPAMRASFAAGRTQVLPLSYRQVAAWFQEHPVDVALLNLAAGEGGRLTSGVVSDFPPILAAGARRRFAVVNGAAPRPRDAPVFDPSGFEALIFRDEPLVAAPQTPEPGTGGEGDLGRIAAHVAGLIPDGARLQTGIGQAPAALFSALSGHRGLSLWSGVLTDGFLTARDAGAFRTGGHVAGIAYCTPEGYARLDGADFVRFADALTTHAPGDHPGAPFCAVNSALEVDLFGQANLEWRDGRLVSGAGGAPEFAGAARASPGGRSILALPATARGGSVSRIVPRLTSPGVSLSRTEADVVVTEHGPADLRSLSMDGRARALIAIAAPRFQEALAEAWFSLRSTL